MAGDLKQHALGLLRQALADPDADFREEQWEAIAAIVEQSARLLIVQRTGWGKSLVYFLATRLLRDRGAGPTLLISPLLALMRNQIAAAERLGIQADSINSSNTDDWSSVQRRLLGGDVDVLLISPERLANDEFRGNVLLPMAQRIGLFVIDEAHCISDWGHDFRPDYRRIARILQALPANIPVLATTATANDRVRRDVADQLGERLRVVPGPLMRESLRLQNIWLPRQSSRMAWLAEQLPHLPGSGIIYTLTVRDAQTLAEWLQLQGLSAHAYYGDLDASTRVILEQRLLDNDIKALVATTALGMGFDKPDLAFVIHYQRPGSVVHYYQQVGRAGRAIADAYGVLLSGDEDDEITDYFIRTAFPPEAHVEEVLEALDEASAGCSISQLERWLNLSRGQIEKVLKSLVVLSPAPVSKRGALWYANPVKYVPDREKIARLTRLRRAEQARMLEYMQSHDCLMRFLGRELDDPTATDCGRCANCRGAPWLPGTYSRALAFQAVQFLRRCEQVILPRKQWPQDALAVYGWEGGIPVSLQATVGRALCYWGDDGWGELVRSGKQEKGRFDDALVAGVVEMVRDRWRPTPAPAWVACVPSLQHPTLVPDFARRVADALGLPYVAGIRKVRSTRPQKAMQNSYQQARNLAGAFAVETAAIPAGPVLLIDDVVDSGWTFTVLAALLLDAGSGPVYPIALAKAAQAGND